MKHLEKPNWRKKQERGKSLRLILLGVFLLVPLVVGMVSLFNSVTPELEISASGATITVKAGGDFQSALNRAKPGDTIVLQAGATYKGSFKLPVKTGNEFITVRTSATDAQLPPADTRLDPQKYVAVLPKIVADSSDPVIEAVNGAHHYRFVGVEFSVARAELDVWKLITIGDGDQTNAAQVPQKIVFDRCYIHAHPRQTGKVRSGLSINGSNIEILNSHISDFRLADDEGHAIVAWNAPGPFRIVNNYIEASGINVLFGGATAHKGMNPADLEFRRNHVTKRNEWRGKYQVKNLFELKDMRRAVIEENVFENNWISAQNGTAILMTPASLQSGADARIENITFRSNIVRRTSHAVVMTGTDYGDPKYPNLPVQNRGVKIENNLFAEIGGQPSEAISGNFLLLTSGAGPDDLTVNHNTIINRGSLIVLDGGMNKNFIFTNNIGFHNEYGIISVGKRGGGIGSGALAAYMGRYIFRKNVIVGAESNRYPAENFYPSGVKDLKFVDFNANNFGLNETSGLKAKGTDGRDIGCDYAAIKQMERKVLAGIGN
jgi:hypothetical protein